MNDRDTIISNMLKAATVENERLRAALTEIADPLMLDIPGSVFGIERALKIINRMRDIAKKALGIERGREMTENFLAPWELLSKRIDPRNCPHCEYDRRFPGFEDGGWMQQDNNGPIVSCPMCNDSGSWPRS